MLFWEPDSAICSLYITRVWWFFVYHFTPPKIRFLFFFVFCWCLWLTSVILPSSTSCLSTWTNQDRYANDVSLHICEESWFGKDPNFWEKVVLLTLTKTWEFMTYCLILSCLWYWQVFLALVTSCRCLENCLWLHSRRMQSDVTLTWC